MKTEAGLLQSWRKQFDDVIKECKTMGAALTDEIKRTYLM
jgi:hypothetical protein